MSAENKAVVRRWFDEVWNQGRGDAIDELISERSVVHGLGPEAWNSLDQLGLMEQIGAVTVAPRG